MELEVLHAAATGDPRPVDILLVHGICVGAWVWQPYFMPYLASCGYNVHALSLRGHGRSEGGDLLHSFSLREYTADLLSVTSRIGRPVIAVGHSMGGAVVQNAIAIGARFAGAALLASVPPNGLIAANVAMFWTQPRLWQELASALTTGIISANLDVLRDGLFANRIDRPTFARFAMRATGESQIVGLELQGMSPFAPFPWQAPPMLVMGGTHDRFIREADLHLTAAWYHTTPSILPDLSHTIMLDPDWKVAADRLLHWIDAVAA
jgi:pimeloyl-ACP methyl ester carboxylesterase